MKFKVRLFAVVVAMICACASAFAQNKVTVTLKDASTGEAVPFATVTLSKPGASGPSYAALSDSEGKVEIADVKDGSYTLKAELLGYVAQSKDVKVKGAALAVGTLKLQVDHQAIDAATVSATGNPIIIKKDTIEFNASSFKTTDNDVLEDLLKKLPGVEVSEDGSITVNGETISKITIDGKTFFMDDPQLASKNIPAKAINKLKVIEKKSEQAEFTGIDDGNEETVIDLSIKPGMMKGIFGNVMGGGGADLPSTSGTAAQGRFQGAGFMGRFTDKSQISVILNGNNTNNRGFNDLAGSMMGGMMGGGGMMGRGQGGFGSGNGITTSYMAGANVAGDLLDDRMELGGNYLYNNSTKEVLESSVKDTYLDDYTLNYDSDGKSYTWTGGHRFGIRLDHKFSDNTSILFQPQINFGNGYYQQYSKTSTYRDSQTHLNDALVNNVGVNRNLSTSGFLLFRQKLGIPGRTLTAMARYSYSNNVLEGNNSNVTTTYELDDPEIITINQDFDNKQNSTTLNGSVTYTEPLGNKFYFELNYAYNWSKSVSDKVTTDAETKEYLDAYSNKVTNESGQHDFGFNFMYQSDKLRAQAGFAAMPEATTNTTVAGSKKYEYYDNRWNFSPRLMLWGDFGENSNGRLFYNGRSSQPSTSQLMPVPDVTDPLNISFGNPNLSPYFTHNLRGEYRYNNKKNFSSLSVRLNGSYVQNPIVSALWYGANGGQYTMPFNGPASGNAGMNLFFNIPIAKSNFSIANTTRANWSMASSYVGTNVDMSKYTDPTVDYYKFMEEFISDHKDIGNCDDFTLNQTQSLGITERLRFVYRADNLELSLGGRTRINKSWYTISDQAQNTLTFNNRLEADANWTWSAIGLTAKAEYRYNWYNGYSTAQPDAHVLNAELQKLLFKNKVTLALKCYDILGMEKNLTVADASNYHTETINNTLGRYIILSLTYRFGTFDRSQMRGPGGKNGPGAGGPPPMM